MIVDALAMVGTSINGYRLTAEELLGSMRSNGIDRSVISPVQPKTYHLQPQNDAVAAGLFFLGLTGWQVFLALIVGITAVYFLMNLTGLAGQRHGVPYSVLARLSFGLFGANIPALIRAIIAIFWYGIQTWLASMAVVVLLLRIWPGLEQYTENSILGLSTLGWICFLILWAAQLFVLRHGMETVRRFVDWAGPAIYVAMFALAIWIVIEAG